MLARTRLTLHRLQSALLLAALLLAALLLALLPSVRAQGAALAQAPAVSFPGNYGQAIGAPSWAPDDPAVAGADADGDGVYTLAVTLPRGSYEFKVALGGSWDENYGLGGEPDGPNIPFDVDAEAEVVFSFDGSSRAIGVTVGGVEVVRGGQPVEASAPAAPPASVGDGQIAHEALHHASRSDLYRAPFGAAPFGTQVTLRLRTAARDVESVALLVDSLSTATSLSLPMQPVARLDGYDWWEAAFDVGDAVEVHNYKFAIADGGLTLYYADDPALDGGAGQVLEARPVNRLGWDIYTYDPAFAAPAWAADAIIYQIFPDRFRNGDPGNDPQTGDWGYPEERGQLFAIEPWNTIVPDPDPQEPSNPWHATWNNTFYGGDLQGVLEKLDYLQALGVNTIYFTPIHEAVTNHRYDARDYRQVDDNLAVLNDPEASWTLFAEFAAAVDARGMRLILDAVPNHTSSDSPLFDRYARHESVGACESEASEFRDRYLFDPAQPAGTGVCAGDTSYRGFAGISTLPQADTNAEAVIEDWLGEEGIALHWLAVPGVAGWRVDTVPDVVAVNPHFFEPFRDVVKQAFPDALLISETWQEEPVRERLLGDEFDTTMNYRFAYATLGFLRDSEFTETNDGTIAPLGPAAYANALRSIEEDYPPAAFATAMNLISSHDFNRAVRTLDHDGVDYATLEPIGGFADGRQRLRLAALLQFTLPGAPMVFYGDEVGLVGFGRDPSRDDPHNRQPYPWEDEAGFDALPGWRKPDASLLAHYQTLGTLRAERSFLRTGAWITLLADDSAGLLAYARTDETGGALVAINRSAVTQTVALSLTGLFPYGTPLLDAFGGAASGAATAAAVGDDGLLSFDVPPLGFRLWLTAEGEQWTPLAAPRVEAETVAGSSGVTLTVTGVEEGAHVAIERSFVDGGFERLAVTESSGDLTFFDASAAPGVRWFYRAVAVGPNGLESAPSATASAMPAPAVAEARLGGPLVLTHTLSAITPTAVISGVVVVPGMTEAVGEVAGLRAELGYLPEGLADMTWVPGQYAGDLAGGDLTGADIYTATLLPEAPGQAIFRWRFSTDQGESWTQSDAGQLTVLPSDDTEPPKPPFRMDALAESNAYVSFAWRVSRPRDLALYRVCRADLTAGEEGCPTLFTLPRTTNVLTDTTVTTGHTYSYTVRLVDSSFNVSEPSDPITLTAELRMVQVTVRVRVPPETPPDDTVYIAGDNAEVFGASFSPALLPLTHVGDGVGDGIWEVVLEVEDGVELQYKYTRGSWESVEQWGTISGFANRRVTIQRAPDGTMLIEDTATDWGTEGPDDRRGVQTWRDPLVTAAEPAPDATLPAPVESVRATFSIFVSADDPAAVLTVADAGGNPLPGRVAADGAQRFVFTPDEPLGPGVYTATAHNVEATTPMIAPYTWTFTVE